MVIRAGCMSILLSGIIPSCSSGIMTQLHAHTPLGHLAEDVEGKGLRRSDAQAQKGTAQDSCRNKQCKVALICMEAGWGSCSMGNRGGAHPFS